MLALSVVMLGDKPEDIRKMGEGKGQFKDSKAASIPLDSVKVWKGAWEFLAARYSVYLLLLVRQYGY